MEEVQTTTAPQVPEHGLNIQPSISKSSVQRSKTVRNLGSSAGNKMKGFFTKKKERRLTTSSTDDHGMSTRPVLSTSASYGPGNNHVLREESEMYVDGNEVDASKLQQEQLQAQQQQLHAQQQQQQQLQAQAQQQQQSQQPPPQPQHAPITTNVDNSTNNTNANNTTSSDEESQQQAQAQQQQAQAQAHAQAQQQQAIAQQQLLAQQQLAQQQAEQQQLNLQMELEKLNEIINMRSQEIQQEKQKKERLQAELNESQTALKEREAEYSSIEHNFFEHTRAIRATDDDLSTIQEAFKLLKYAITRFTMTLNKKGDKQKATQKFVSFFPHLNIVDEKGEMDPSFVNILSEKLIHEHLIKHIFNAPIYPGLKVNDAYQNLSSWLTLHNSQFSVRLRQQMASVVAKSKENSEIQKAVQKEKMRISQLIYQDLCEVYDPFLSEYDATADVEKKYSNKVNEIVEKALRLSLAIRGQEVEIATVPIEEENKKPVDLETMAEVKGKEKGMVRFCICPIFMGGDGEHGFVEKARVFIPSS